METFLRTNFQIQGLTDERKYRAFHGCREGVQGGAPLGPKKTGNEEK